MRFCYRVVLWIVLLAAGIAHAATPQVNSTSPVTGPTGTQVQINGSGFGATQGASTVKFTAAFTASIVSWSDTQIVAVVPSAAYTGPVLVTVGGVSSNQSVYFNVPAPRITSISPATGIIGTQVTVNGSGFQATKGANSSISFNGLAGTVITWSDTQIVANVPVSATSGAVSVSVNGVISNQDQLFTLPNPLIAGVIPTNGPVGTVVQISGSGFGASQGSSTLKFKTFTSTVNAAVTSWTDTSITATVPATAVSGLIAVVVGGITSSSNIQFTIPPPKVNSVTPVTGVAGAQITVTGSGFQATKGSSTLSINGFAATTTTWNDSQIVASVPSSATTGPVSVTVNSVASNQDVLFTVPNPIVTSVSPSSGPVNTQINVNGSGFGATQGTSTLKIQGVTASVTSWSNTQIVATVPVAAITGYVSVTVAGVSSPTGDVYFTIPGPQITSVAPNSGAPGIPVTINGSGFRSTQTVGQNTSSLKFNGFSAPITSWSDTQIVATVPANATTGPVTVTGTPGASNADHVFTTANPIVVSLSPSSGRVGTQVNINGSGFGTTTGTATFSGVAAAIVSWSDTQIVATVPTTVRSGAVSVITSGVTSNSNIVFTIPPPQITSIVPSSGAAGTQVTVTGSGFQATRGTSSLSFSPSGTAFSIVSWSDTQIVATVPAAFGPNAVRVTVNGGDSNNDLVFTLPSPVVTGISPIGGPVGTQIQISGSGFTTTQGTVAISFVNAPIVSWSDTLITATVASGITTGVVRVTAGGATSAATPQFTVGNLVLNTISPAAGPVGTPVTITGKGFGTPGGTSSVSFNNVAATFSSWTDTQIVTNVPTGAATGSVKVTVSGTSTTSNPTFTVGSVLVSGINPASGGYGIPVQISGSGFGSTQGTSFVTFWGGWRAAIVNWSDTLITANVPASAITGAVTVTVNNVASNSTVNFTVSSPTISGISPSRGAAGTQIQVSGTGFGGTQGSSTFSFNGISASVVSWSDTLLTVTVPTTATSGTVWATVNGVPSPHSLFFTVPDPQIVSITPTTGIVGTQVTINGSGFRAAQGSNSVLFNGNTASITTWSDTQIVATVPALAKTGPVTISGTVSSNQDVVFTLPNPTVNALSPSSGPMNTQVQITGSGFGATQGSSTVNFNGVQASVVNWSDALINATVPSTATTGAVAVSVGGVTSSSTLVFSIPPPHVSAVSPSTGALGTQITLTGSGFHALQGPGSVNFFSNLASAPIISWSDTQIVATVPSTAAGSAIAVHQNQWSNSDVDFVLINPRISGLAPTSGPVGTQVQINGSGFGATQGTSTVQIAGCVASISSWSDTQIVATVPAASKSGTVVVYEGVVSSNTNINFTVPAAHIASISPSSGQVGTVVTITGSGFQSSPGAVSFNGAHPLSFISWSDTQIVAAAPTNATSGAVVVLPANNTLSNADVVFTMPNPIVTGLVPASGPTGTQVQINGTGFGATQGNSVITFSYVSASVVSWSDTQIVAVVPPTAVTGAVQVTQGGIASNRSVLFNVPVPTIASISPAIGGQGNLVTITGTGFHPSPVGSSLVQFAGGGGQATIKSWSDTQIVAVVPNATVTGFVLVTANGIPSNYANYTIPSTFVATLTPNTGPVGTSVTLAGTAFGSSQGTSVLTFNGQVASASSWTDTQIVATVPVTAATGPAVITANGINSNATAVFTVPPPYISNYSPHGGVPGTQVTINGTAFQPTQRNSTVTFNGVSGTITSWSDTQIIANVPATASTGALQVNVNATSSPSWNSFEVPTPTITSVNPPEAPQTGIITITGTGFGASDRYSPDGTYPVYVGFVQFNGAQVLALSWSDTSLTVRVPETALSGPITILKYNAVSNGQPFAVEGAPAVTSLSPDNGPVGTTLTVNGTGFGSVQGGSSVSFNGAPAFVSSWSDTSIVAVVPPGASTGPVNVTVASVTGPTSNFKLTQSVQVTDSLGHTTAYHFEQLGGKWHFAATGGTGCSTCGLHDVLNLTVGGSTTHQDNGDISTTTDELTHTTTYTWDGDHNLLSQSTPLDAGTQVTTTYTYNSFGEPLTVIDPLGNKTTNGYDTNGNLVSVTSEHPDATTAQSVTGFTYDAKGELTLITDPLGHHTMLAYYPTGLINTITDEVGDVTTYEYDLRGNRTAVVDAAQNRTTFDYDLGNRLTKITYPDTTFVSFAYDSRGRRTSVTDQNGKITTYAYDDADRLTSVTDAALNVTQYAYDTENDLLSITDAAQHTTSFVYDSLRRVTQTVFPSTLTESYVYDAVGNLTSKTDRKNQTILYIYDALNRLTHKGYPDATGVDYVYDLAGKIKQVSDPTGVYGFAYDNMGRLVGSSTQYAFLPGHTYSNAYTYDAASNRTGFTAPDGSTATYVYDTLGRLATLTDSQTGQFGFSYDALSRRTGLTRPNGVNTTYNFDSLSRLASVLHKAGTTTLDGAGYAYDNAGNRTSKTNYLNNITEQYTYDPLYQLTQVTQGLTTTESYAYDPVGNRLSSLGMSPYAYNSSNELTSTPSAMFTYDNNGNTTSKADASGTTTYSWDFENRLTAVTLPGTNGTVTFEYDPFGRRIQKSSSSGTTNYLYEGSNSIADLDAAGNLVARYTQGAGIDEQLAQLRSGTVGYYDQDGLGSVTTLSGATGAIGNSYTYDTFGNLVASTGSDANPFQYTGRDFDSETGLRYYRARYYDPATGRFISEDPLGFGGGDGNSYRYVFGNPQKFTDPSGLAGKNPVAGWWGGIKRNAEYAWNWWWETQAAGDGQWTIENGKRYIFYGPNTAETQDMMNSPGGAYIQLLYRLKYHCKGSPQNNDFPTLIAYMTTTQDPSNTAFEVGAFSFDIDDMGDGTVRYRMYNKSGLHSLIGHFPFIHDHELPPDSAMQEMHSFGGNIRQLFEWRGAKPCCEGK